MAALPGASLTIGGAELCATDPDGKRGGVGTNVRPCREIARSPFSRLPCRWPCAEHRGSNGHPRSAGREDARGSRCRDGDRHGGRHQRATRDARPAGDSRWQRRPSTAHHPGPAQGLGAAVARSPGRSVRGVRAAPQPGRCRVGVAARVGRGQRAVAGCARCRLGAVGGGGGAGARRLLLLVRSGFASVFAVVASALALWAAAQAAHGFDLRRSLGGLVAIANGALSITT